VSNLAQQRKIRHDAALIVSKLVYFAIEPFFAAGIQLPGMETGASAGLDQLGFLASAMGPNRIGSTDPIF
jgi:hypothetical protein